MTTREPKGSHMHIIETDANPAGWPTRKSYTKRYNPRIGERIVVLFQNDGTEHTAVVVDRFTTQRNTTGYVVRQDFNGLVNVFESDQIRRES